MGIVSVEQANSVEALCLESSAKRSCHGVLMGGLALCMWTIHGTTCVTNQCLNCHRPLRTTPTPRYQSDFRADNGRKAYTRKTTTVGKKSPDTLLNVSDKV